MRKEKENISDLRNALVIITNERFGSVQPSMPMNERISHTNISYRTSCSQPSHVARQTARLHPQIQHCTQVLLIIVRLQMFLTTLAELMKIQQTYTC